MGRIKRLNLYRLLSPHKTRSWTASGRGASTDDRDAGRAHLYTNMLCVTAGRDPDRAQRSSVHGLGRPVSRTDSTLPNVLERLFCRAHTALSSACTAAGVPSSVCTAASVTSSAHTATGRAQSSAHTAAGGLSSACTAAGEPSTAQTVVQAVRSTSSLPAARQIPSPAELAAAQEARRVAELATAYADTAARAVAAADAAEYPLGFPVWNEECNEWREEPPSLQPLDVQPDSGRTQEEREWARAAATRYIADKERIMAAARQHRSPGCMAVGIGEPCPALLATD
jgi:hypothetical protein